MDQLKHTLIACFLRIILVATPNFEINKEFSALGKMMDNSETVMITIDKLCEEYNVSIRLVDADMKMLYEHIIRVATHEFMIKFDNNMFELLEDNIVVTSYFACSSGC